MPTGAVFCWVLPAEPGLPLQSRPAASCSRAQTKGSGAASRRSSKETYKRDLLQKRPTPVQRQGAALDRTRHHVISGHESAGASTLISLPLYRYHDTNHAPAAAASCCDVLPYAPRVYGSTRHGQETPTCCAILPSGRRAGGRAGGHEHTRSLSCASRARALSCSHLLASSPRTPASVLCFLSSCGCLMLSTKALA